MWIAVVNNIPEMALGGLWTGTMLWLGYKLGRKWERRKFA